MSARAQDILIGIPTAQSNLAGVADHGDCLNGAMMAIEMINTEGGINGRMLKPEVVDIDILSPEGAARAFQILSERKVHAIASSFVIIPQPAMAAAAAYGGPDMHGNTSKPGVALVAENRDRYKNIFMIDPDETWYGYGFVRYLDHPDATGQGTPVNRKIPIVQEQVAHTRVISQAAQKSIAESGGEYAQGPIADIQFPVQDWPPVTSALQDSGAGVVFIGHWVAAELAAFSRQFAFDPVPVSLVLLQYGPSQPEFPDLAQGAAEGMIRGAVLGTARATPRANRSAKPIWPGMARPWAKSIPPVHGTPSACWPKCGSPCHPKIQTPWSSLSASCGMKGFRAPIPFTAPGSGR